jgi:hypothetical protein
MSFLCIKHILEKHEAQFYVAEIALALDYLHRRGVIHRYKLIDEDDCVFSFFSVEI